MYIHELPNWTDFRWDGSRIALLVDEVCHKQGRLIGSLSAVGFDGQLMAMADNLANDVIHSSEIEGIQLNADSVRSSIARRLGIESVRAVAPSRYVDSVVAVMLDAVQNYDKPLTHEKLWAWQASFFPAGVSEGYAVETGKYRTHAEHIVSGMFGREKVHYEAPAPARVPQEMARFLAWFNDEPPMPSVVRSAIAHFWFVSIHPFEDGNGRLARILSDMLLAKGDKSKLRFYNISSAINRDKRHYYRLLEQSQRGDGDLTDWIEWYARTLIAALDESIRTVDRILQKSLFWQSASATAINQRQRQMLNLFLDGYQAKITAKNWASLAKCSRDTATRDLNDLVAKHILREEVPGAKRPAFLIIYPDDGPGQPDDGPGL